MGKLKTEVTSPIAKSTTPGLSDTTFFARCYNDGKIITNLSEWVESILYPKNIVQPDYLSSAW